MPTVLRRGPYRLFFYAGDGAEPTHVHIERDRAVAKFWLDPVRFESASGFRSSELQRIHRIVDDNVVELLEAWRDFFEG